MELERLTLKNSYKFCFEKKQGYKPIMKASVIKKVFLLKKIVLNLKSNHLK